MTLTNPAVAYCARRLAFFLHCEAMAGAPGEDRYAVVCQARRHAEIAKYRRWLVRHAGFVFEEKGRWN